MKSKKKKYDMNSPETEALMAKIGHGSFTLEGHFVAFPLCFPGASTPIPLDESKITALDTHGDQVYGGTSGNAAHLFVADFRGATGAVLDLGAIEKANHCAAVCCAADQLVALVNAPNAGRVVLSPYHAKFADLIQEWGFQRKPFKDLGAPVPGEKIVHGVTLPEGKLVLGATTGHLFLVDVAAAKMEVLGEVPGKGELVVTSSGAVLGQDGPEHLWRFDPKSRELQRRAVALPKGNWDAPLVWARDAHAGLLYTADAQGQLYACDESKGYAFTPRAKAPLAPVGPMAVSLDGRLFGACGNEMAHTFVLEPNASEARDLGVALSVLQRRRYGYEFGAAVTGPDGQIYFGESDNLGHLFIYFPRIWRA